MRNITLSNITEVAAGSFSGLPDTRQRELVQGLVEHLHAFVRTHKLTHEEWRSAIRFMHQTAALSTDSRSEFTLLSDVTGVSSLVDLLASDPSATPGSVLGPFHTVGSPWATNPANLIRDNAGQRVLLRGNVTDTHGQPLADATLDFWQNASNGMYWQMDSTQPTDNLRCQLKVDPLGHFEIATIRAVPYQIPTDGPVWLDLVQPSGRGSWRPAHFHLIVSAPGHRTLVTEVFDSEDPYLDIDAVFGVRTALIGRYETVNDADACARLGVSGAHCLVMNFDVRLSGVRES